MKPIGKRCVVCGREAEVNNVVAVIGVSGHPRTDNHSLYAACRGCAVMKGDFEALITLSITGHWEIHIPNRAKLNKHETFRANMVLDRWAQGESYRASLGG